MFSHMLSKQSETNSDSTPATDNVTWQQMLDRVQANVMLADKDLNVLYVNSSAAKTLKGIEGTIKETFGVAIEDVLGGSIHRFHKDPARIERILEDPKALPHQAEFSFGGVTLSAVINGVYDEQGQLYGYIVNWEDVTKRVASEQRMTQLANMLENLPLNVIFADRDLVVQYMNPASKNTLRKLEHLLPVPVDAIVGTCIDKFHKNPSHQRNLLADPSNLPIHTQIELGEEVLDLLVSAIYDLDQQYIGAMATWSIVTKEVNTKNEAERVGQSVASTSTEMAASINEISNSVSLVANMAKQAEGFSDKTSRSIEKLSDSSDHIGNFVDVIRELADQTNLLALNATIEAARAGESGRSFAVVASEVKELSKETTNATQSIGERVTGIQGCISEVVEASKEIAQAIGEVSQNTNTIAAAIEEQSVTMNELSRSAEGLVNLTK